MSEATLAESFAHVERTSISFISNGCGFVDSATGREGLSARLTADEVHVIEALRSRGFSGGKTSGNVRFVAFAEREKLSLLRGLAHVVLEAGMVWGGEGESFWRRIEDEADDDAVHKAHSVAHSEEASDGCASLIGTTRCSRVACTKKECSYGIKFYSIIAPNTGRVAHKQYHKENNEPLDLCATFSRHPRTHRRHARAVAGVPAGAMWNVGGCSVKGILIVVSGTHATTSLPTPSHNTPLFPSVDAFLASDGLAFAMQSMRPSEARQYAVGNVQMMADHELATLHEIVLTPLVRMLEKEAKNGSSDAVGALEYLVRLNAARAAPMDQMFKRIPTPTITRLLDKLLKEGDARVEDQVVELFRELEDERDHFTFATFNTSIKRSTRRKKRALMAGEKRLVTPPRRGRPPRDRDTFVVRTASVCLYWMSREQARLLHLYGHEGIILVDGTHNTNSHRYQLVTILIINHEGRGVPVAHALLETVSKSTLCSFFEWVCERLKDLKLPFVPEVVAIDLSPTETAAVKAFFPLSALRWCYFHFSAAALKYFNSETSIGFKIAIALHHTSTPQQFVDMMADIALVIGNAFPSRLLTAFEENNPDAMRRARARAGSASSGSLVDNDEAFSDDDDNSVGGEDCDYDVDLDDWVDVLAALTNGDVSSRKRVATFFFGKDGKVASASHWARAWWTAWRHYSSTNHLESYHRLIKVDELIGALVVRVPKVIRNLVRSDGDIIARKHYGSLFAAAAYSKHLLLHRMDDAASEAALGLVSERVGASAVLLRVKARKAPLFRRAARKLTFVEEVVHGAFIVAVSSERALKLMAKTMATVTSQSDLHPVLVGGDLSSIVTFTVNDHFVRLGREAHGSLCDCLSFANLGYICKHVLAAVYSLLADKAGALDYAGGMVLILDHILPATYFGAHAICDTIGGAAVERSLVRDACKGFDLSPDVVALLNFGPAPSPTSNSSSSSSRFRPTRLTGDPSSVPSAAVLLPDTSSKACQEREKVRLLNAIKAELGECGSLRAIALGETDLSPLSSLQFIHQYVMRIKAVVRDPMPVIARGKRMRRTNGARSKATKTQLKGKRKRAKKRSARGTMPTAVTSGAHKKRKGLVPRRQTKQNVGAERTYLLPSD